MTAAAMCRGYKGGTAREARAPTARAATPTFFNDSFLRKGAYVFTQIT
jgi:hypothetical protein